MLSESTIKTEGMVLDAVPQKEADRRIVLLTPELGQLSVFANGARREKSPLRACSQKFVMGTFYLYPSGRFYRLQAAEIRETFPELTLDLERMVYASYFSELTEYFTKEGIPARDELNLLYVTERALIRGRQKNELIRLIFETKLLDLEGVGLQLSGCVVCGKQKVSRIDLSLGGAVCDDCVKEGKSHAAREISAGALYVLRYILSAKIQELYSFNTTENIIRELSEIVPAYTRRHCDRDMKSLDILKPIL